MTVERESGPPPSNLFGRLLELLSDSFVYGLSTLLTQIVAFGTFPGSTEVIFIREIF